jgi:hypothetical protein
LIANRSFAALMERGPLPSIQSALLQAGQQIGGVCDFGNHL